jgi:pSer/pThr/pTyr-binding forkhead associated (FHA) protein
MLGGRGPNALPLTALELSPEVAMIVVPPSGPATIQRLVASVVVRLDQIPIGIAPKPLQDGVQIEFAGCSLTFTSDDAGDAMVTSTSLDETTGEFRSAPQPATLDAPVHASTTRIVNVRTGDAIDLGNERIVVGRDEACDLVVPGMGVSRRHFSVAPVQGGYLLRDESANGTLVNGARVSGTCLLGHGDVIRVDEEELCFEVEGGVAAPPSSTTAAPTTILDVSRLKAELAMGETRERPVVASVAATLEIVRGPYARASFSIDRPACSIGRGPQSDVRIRDESVSAAHATLLRKGNAWFVVDLRSANGTFVDGSRVAGERELASGSRLKLGRVEMVFRALDAGGREIEPRRRRSWWKELLRPFQHRKAEPDDEN